MAHPAELLGRLNAKTVDWTGAGGGKGGLSPSDVAFLLAGLPRHIEMVLLATYAAQADAWDEIREILARRVGEEAKRRRWKLRRSEASIQILTGLVDIAMEEVLQPPHCKRCSGRGTVVAKGLVTTCSQCTGTGLGRISNAEKARRCGLHPSSFKSTWSPRLEFPVRLLRDWMVTGLSHIRNRL